MSSKSRSRYRLLALALCAGAVAPLLLGCAASSTGGGAGSGSEKRASAAARKGFLGDYGDLASGGPGGPQLAWVNPNANFSRYHSVWIESVTLWQDGSRAKLSKDEAPLVTQHLYLSIEAQLSLDYTIVDASGPGVMRVRAAVSEKKGARGRLNVVTSEPPDLPVASTLGRLESHTTIFLASAAIEAEVLDSTSGERLAAAVNEKLATAAAPGPYQKWGQVEKAFDAFGEQLRARLEVPPPQPATAY